MLGDVIYNPTGWYLSRNRVGEPCPRSYYNLQDGVSLVTGLESPVLVATIIHMLASLSSPGWSALPVALLYQLLSPLIAL